VSYHPLSRDSGSDDDRRRQEANDLLLMLRPHFDDMASKHQKFWNDMQQKAFITVKELFYLRDLRDRYVE
jgi:hypothetical protein